jgi:2-polyprenyl-3-methyl-5-hydroxy-6-metoxy-1,4-benzoquinol methylase
MTVAVENDYLSNLDVVERFPFSIYHRPIRNHVLRLIREREAGGRTLSILNVGCGLSQVLKAIDPRHTYHGVDVDERAVEMCRQRFASRQARFDVSEPYSLPAPDGAYDVVFATEVVEHVLEPERWLAELVRKLAPGGALQLSTPNYGGWLLPLIERTFLEWMARRQGFTRKGLHPTPFDSVRLGRLLQGAGLANVEVRKTPLNLALIGTGYA